MSAKPAIGDVASPVRFVRRKRYRRSFALAPGSKAAKYPEKAGKPPYASIQCDLLACKRFRALSDDAVRLFLLLQANYNLSNDGTRFETFVAVDHAAKLLRTSHHTVTAAFTELEESPFLVRIADGVRPRAMGAGHKIVMQRGRCATYDLPSRHQDQRPTWKQIGDKSIKGKWRIYSGRIRARLGSMTAAEAKIWAHLHARPHNKYGGVLNNELGRSATELRRFHLATVFGLMP